jgi:hypothetical protein
VAEESLEMPVGKQIKSVERALSRKRIFWIKRLMGSEIN